MAYKEIEPTANSGMFDPYNHFWAIHRSVGWSCENHTDDVMLIQYLINSLKITEHLEPDGLFGNKTYNAVKCFQRWVNRKEGECTIVDGKVNAVDPDTYYTKSGRVYTIYALNYKYIEKKYICYGDLRIDRELPPVLNAIFSAIGG